MATATAPNRAQRRAAAKSNGHKKYLSMKDFEHDPVVPIDIAGWGPVLYELPDLSAELALQRVPNALRGALARALMFDMDTTDREPEDLKDFFLMQANVIVRHLKQPDVLGHFGGDEEAAAEWLLDPRRGPGPAFRLQLWQASVLHNISTEAFADTFQRGRAGSRPSGDGGQVEAEAE